LSSVFIVGVCVGYFILATEPLVLKSISTEEKNVRESPRIRWSVLVA